VALFQRHVSLFPIRPRADDPSAAALFAEHPERPHLEHGDLEHTLDYVANRVLARLRPHPEHDLVAFLADSRALLGDERRENQILAGHRASPLGASPLSRASIARATGSLISTSS